MNGALGLCDSAPLDFGIHVQKVGRREDVEDLRRGEFDDILMLLGDARDLGGRVVPPLLIEQEALIEKIVWPTSPCFVREPFVLWQRINAGRVVPVQGATRRVIGEPPPFTHPSSNSSGFIFPITRQSPRSARGLKNCGRSPVSIVALSCAPKPCGGAATAASLRSACRRRSSPWPHHGAH